MIGRLPALKGADMLAAAAWIALAFLPLGLNDWLRGDLATYFTYGIFAMSLAFVWGHCGLLCLGQGVFFGLGAYAMSVTTLGMLPGAPALISSWLGLVFAVVLPAVAAQLLGRFFFGGRGLHGAFFGIVTLALAFIAERAAINWDYLGGLNGLMNIPPINLGVNGGGFEIWDTTALYYLHLAVAFAVFAVLTWLLRSPYGTALAAIRDDEERTRSFGYDAAQYKTTAFSIGAAVAGLSGALFVAQFGFASPPLIGFKLSAEVLIWVALGGRGMLFAAFTGAILVRTLEGYLSETFGQYWLLALGLLFVLAVIVFPRGLIGEFLHRAGGWIDRQRRQTVRAGG